MLKVKYQAWIWLDCQVQATASQKYLKELNKR